MSTNGGAAAATSAPATTTKPLPTIPDYGDYAIDIQNLTFSYRSDSAGGSSYVQESSSSCPTSSSVLEDLNLTLKTGARCLLIGANGSGKSVRSFVRSTCAAMSSVFLLELKFLLTIISSLSLSSSHKQQQSQTLLRILAGRHLTKSVQIAPDGSEHRSTASVLGLNAFHDTRLNFHRAYLDCDWGMRSVAFVGGAVPLMADIPVRNMMEKLQNSYPDRRDELLDMLGVDLDWRMHQLSDGQRRRVQLFLGLVRPFRVLLLDEVTVSLDVCVRQDLLRWLVRESDERGATVLYATHIFDGLDDWATHLYYLNDSGRCGWQGPMQELEIYHTLRAQNHPCKMLAIAEHWLRKELDAKRANRKFERAQGALAHEQSEVLERSQGGYASGRLETDEERQARLVRHGRISDLRGNAGVLDKVRRVAN
jgi:CCR4-NOT complex subunit CAF16